MTIDNRFWKKKLEQYEKLFVLYSQATHLPFLICDGETFDDEVAVSPEEARIRELAEAYAKYKYPVMVVNVPKVQIQRFLRGLYSLGANALQVREGDLPAQVDLSQLVPEPSGEAEEGKLPKRNPQLQLTALYFLQELRRPVQRSLEERKKLRDQEEEMAVCLMKSRLILAVDISEVPGKWNPKDPSQKDKLPFVKDGAGNAFLPCFSELGEFEKFQAKHKEQNQGKRFCLLSVSYGDLPKYRLPQSKGFVLNPAGFHLILTPETLEQMRKNYGEG